MAAPSKVYGGLYGDEVNDSRWVVIYPTYIDSTLKISGGRKIAVDKCVPKPNAMEIFESTKLTGLQTCIELDKAYSRDYWVRGRVRVCLFDAEGKPVNEQIPNRKTLYATVAKSVPKVRDKAKAKAAKANANAKPAGRRKRKGKR